MYASPGLVEINSDPVNAALINATEFVSNGFQDTDGFQWQFENDFDYFWEFSSVLVKGARGLVVF